MQELNLANKYRPATTKSLVGQPQVRVVVEAMLRRWQAGEIRLPTGIILTGPKGSGKTSLARIIAATLNCEAAEKPCTVCPSCVAIYNQTSDSVLELDGATSGNVADIRALKGLANLSHSGEYRIIIIDESQQISNAGNASLLKQLEEPPSKVLYVFATTEFDQILPTIVSRCLVFQYYAIQPEVVAQRLTQICEAESFAFEPEALLFIAKRAKGAMRDAIMMLEHLSLVEDISLARCQELWFANLDVFAERFVVTALKGEVEAGMRLVQSTFVSQRDVQALSDSIVLYLRNVAVGLVQRPTALTFTKIADLIALTWDLRVRFRSASLSDPLVIETLWFVFAKTLGAQGTLPAVKVESVEVVTTVSIMGGIEATSSVTLDKVTKESLRKMLSNG